MYGDVELSFDNTKIIQNGRVLDIEEAEMMSASKALGEADTKLGTTVEELKKAREKELDRLGEAGEDDEEARKEAFKKGLNEMNLGKMKAGMDSVDKEMVKRVIEE